MKGLATVGEVLTVTRELYSTLLHARRFVDDAVKRLPQDYRGDAPGSPMATLERIDGALADAGELLGRRTV